MRIHESIYKHMDRFLLGFKLLFDVNFGDFMRLFSCTNACMSLLISFRFMTRLLAHVLMNMLRMKRPDFKSLLDKDSIPQTEYGRHMYIT
jgi:hypothetical protein